MAKNLCVAKLINKFVAIRFDAGQHELSHTTESNELSLWQANDCGGQLSELNNGGPFSVLLSICYKNDRAISTKLSLSVSNLNIKMNFSSPFFPLLWDYLLHYQALDRNRRSCKKSREGRSSSTSH